MAQESSRPTATTGRASLGTERFLARLGMIVERAAPLALPLALVALAYVATAWFGVFRAVSEPVRIALGLGFVCAAIFALWPLLKLRFPSRYLVERRLERDNNLAHTPITIASDRVAGKPDPITQTLWDEHQKRMANQTHDMSGITPLSRVPERDPWALRTIAPLVAVIAFAFSFSPQGGRIGDVFRSHAEPASAPMRVDAWITPPTYTGIAPVFLTADINIHKSLFTVPEGSVAKIRLSGGIGDEIVLFDGVDMTLTEEQAASSDASRSFETVLRRDGELLVRRGNNDLNSWAIGVTDDASPEIRFADAQTRMTRAANGSWTLNYFARDDYRLRSARAIIELDTERHEDARPLYQAPDMPLALPRRSAQDGAARTTRDLTEHPWAGARIKLTLEAEDDLAQLGTSATLTTVLPGRPFSDPLARAIIEQRRRLALDANKAADLIDVLDTLTLYPEETIDNASHFLGLTTARTRLAEASTDDELRDVVEYLWEIARQIEDGDLSLAERRLRQAQQALQEALENGATDEEIEQLTAELREAMQDYMRELAQQMQNNPQAQQPMDTSRMQQFDMQSLDEMLERLQELAEQGAREQALDMLSQLNEMMNNLQMGQQQGQQGQQQSRAQQQMNELGEILRQQQELMNETFRQNRDGQQSQQGQQGQQSQNGDQQQGQNQPGQQGQSPQNGQQGEGGLQSLAPGQQALQDRLDQFMQSLRDMGIESGEAFGRAGESMQGAGEALSDSEGESALAQQGDAMEALREGAGEMMEQLQQQAQRGQGQSRQPGMGNQRADDRDPLGRPQRSSGPDFGDSVDIPDEIDVRRAREILEAIRRRLGDALSPQLERDYMERLLDLN